MKTPWIPSPLFLRVILFILSPKYRAAWKRLDERSNVTGVAREEVILWQGWGHRWVIQRESINRKVRGRLR